MACNCSANEEIEKIYELYGEKLRENPVGMTIFDWIKKIWFFIVSILLYAIVIPIMFVYVILVLLWKDEPRINVDNIDFIKLNRKIKNKVKECQIAISHIE